MLLHWEGVEERVRRPAKYGNVKILVDKDLKRNDVKSKI